MGSYEPENDGEDPAMGIRRDSAALGYWFYPRGRSLPFMEKFPPVTSFQRAMA